MKRTAVRRLLVLAVICGMVLSLPGVLLAAATAAAPGCSHCRNAGPGLTSGCCCCRPDVPGCCGAANQGGSSTCRCAAGTGPAFISPAVTSAHIFQAAAHVYPLITVSSPIFPSTIFHPPESQT